MTLVGKARVARDYKQRPAAREVCDNVLGNPVREILLVGVTAHIVECQDSNRGPVRQRQVFGGALYERLLDGPRRSSFQPRHEYLNRPSDVPLAQQPKLLEL